MRNFGCFYCDNQSQVWLLGDERLRLRNPALIDELILVLLPLIERHGVELLARDSRNSRSQSANAGFADLGIVRRFDVDVLLPLPFPCMRLGHSGDLGFGPVREMQLTLEPQRHGSRDEVGTMSGARLESEFEDVLIAAMQRNGPFPQVFEKALRTLRFACDYPIHCAVEDEGSTAQGVQMIEDSAAVAEKHE